ncbi:type III restriction-modification system DNA methyltransferase [Fusobacterium animalis ATCC 51191]|uniref:Type III restriction-modification system DNA methyltransferase n=1 Tax=Fusobacterium animalis ATCC 51191 TaxID=997347 RepID=F9EJQ5_9FUSO|nr:type III restriction-modification system DNA methyltransferase [Fusobacterium animalis ATCC 51191]
MSILNFYSRQGKHDLEKLGMGDMFSTAKPVELIKYLIKISSNKNDIILDFFAGSGTTAEAVLKLNKEENSERKFILCQIDEKILNNKKSIEKLKGYNYKNSIASITKLRLKKIRKII